MACEVKEMKKELFLMEFNNISYVLSESRLITIFWSDVVHTKCTYFRLNQYIVTDKSSQNYF